MIIDAHVHIGYNDSVNAPVEKLIKQLDKAKIDKALVLAGEFSACPTELTLAKLAPYTDRLVAIGSVSPLYSGAPSPEQVEIWLAQGQINGLKFYPGYEYFYPADPALRPYLELLGKYRRPAIFHSGDTYSKSKGAKLKYAHPLNIDDLATDLPDLSIVIAHIGYPWVIDAGEVCYKNPNVYVDCSGFVYGTFDERQLNDFKASIDSFVRVAGGTDKILFGSDWPVGEPWSYVEAAKQVFGDNEQIFSGNAIRLFGLEG